ncbi:ATP-dependent RNA helicase SUPV3L1/SUV3 [Clostridium cavendishii DSM 21758]|uniref:RNA helicase n=1 Tax=Clostridium cavendishii DSM 21758 TaxID=1121302 RepID=A0A1M6NIE4_9CLOT|nr:helicase-related protein [Clostridium cavendishii]SHJ95501.1 ATP-dependent RNA helicase SUPV3L1/SUV3 [Clostridium cavendishii DSM 21758]
MKKGVMERNFKKLKSQIPQIEQIVRHTKINALWEHDAAIRKKIRELDEFKDLGFKDYKNIYKKYLELLEYISIRLIEGYNKKNNTSYSFDEVVSGNFNNYLRSGIISVLVSTHIPKMISKEFERVFPSNPKDEYREARLTPRKIFLHLGETNTGKTYNAMMRLKEASKGIYLSPLRILALENYERLNKEGVKCNLLTGEEEVLVEGANHISCTIEKLNINEEYEIAIIDEIQMINDDQRGIAWTRALLGLRCKEIHICGAINAKDLLIEIIEDCKDAYEIKEYRRTIPLIPQREAFSYKDVQDGDALVVFSKKRVLELATHYSNLGIRCSLIYGDLPPEVRRKQYEQFISKESTVLITTDAIGMGVNLPIKRIVFMDIKKFDGNEIRFLTSQEVKQIAGRAGRIGIYDEGFVASYGNTQEFIYDALETDDKPIQEAVLGPSEEILKIKNLPLKEKLALWSNLEEKVPYYRKMNISEYLIILDSIKFYKLSEIIEWSLLKIPFDVSNDELLSWFLNYIDELFVAKKEILSKPILKFNDLYELEIYYQKINLYYSFSKVFNLEFDESWVYDARITVSESINNILLKL